MTSQITAEMLDNTMQVFRSWKVILYDGLSICSKIFLMAIVPTIALILASISYPEMMQTYLIRISRNILVQLCGGIALLALIAFIGVLGMICVVYGMITITAHYECVLLGRPSSFLTIFLQVILESSAQAFGVDDIARNMRVIIDQLTPQPVS